MVDGAEFAGMRLFSPEEITTGGFMPAAVDALSTALQNGLDPERDAHRSRLITASGELLLMPSALGAFSGVKILSSTPDNHTRDLPAIQGLFVLFEGLGQRPAAAIDGAALTNLRTPAVSALALRHLTGNENAGAARLTVFGSGPQARKHVEAVQVVRPVSGVTLVARRRQRLEALTADIAATGLPTHAVHLDDCADAVAAADIICCCTSTSTPLFDGTLVKDDAVVIAMGSHSPGSREVDGSLARRASIVVESRASALREAGDVIIPLSAGVIGERELITLSDVITGRAAVPETGPRLFKSTGMPWEDLVVARMLYQAGQ